jgi:hypothetical protein
MSRRSLWLVLLFAVGLLSVFLGWSWYEARTHGIEVQSLQPQQIRVIPPVIEPQRLLADVEELSFPRFTAGDRQRARRSIVQSLEQAGWQPQLQDFGNGVNILAEKPGTDPAAGPILLGAHYDTVARSPGADDNTTSVATILEVARLLAQQPMPRTLQLAFFDLEEAGLLGSQAYVRQMPAAPTLEGAILLDMIGYACSQPGCQSYPPLPITPPTNQGDFLAAIGDQGHPQLTDTLVKAGDTHLPQVLTLSVPTFGALTPDLIRSDHTPFWRKGIGAVLLTDTANFRNPNYHQPSDTPDTIDQSFFLGCAQIIVNALTDLLQS